MTGAALVDAVVDRSRRYTSEREALAAPADRNSDLAARALFFTIADAAKPALPLLELARAGHQPRWQHTRGRGPDRVLDQLWRGPGHGVGAGARVNVSGVGGASVAAPTVMLPRATSADSSPAGGSHAVTA